MSLVDIFQGQLPIMSWKRDSLRPPPPVLAEVRSDLRRHDLRYMQTGIPLEERIRFLFLRLLQTLSYHAGWLHGDTTSPRHGAPENLVPLLRQVASDLRGYGHLDGSPAVDPEDLLREDVISACATMLQQERMLGEEALDDIVESVAMQDAARCNCGNICRVCGYDATCLVGAKNGHRVRMCENCGLAFVSNWWTRDALKLCGPGPANAAQHSGHEYRSTDFLSFALDRLQGGNRKLNILDFGCGIGWLCDALRDEGHNVVGVDVVAPALTEKNRWTGDIRDFPVSRPEFDLVVSFQVFEHIPFPWEPLVKLLEVAKPGGLVVIHTNYVLPEKRENMLEWDYFIPPSHCSFYCHRTLGLIASSCGARSVYADPWQVCFEKDLVEGART